MKSLIIVFIFHIYLTNFYTRVDTLNTYEMNYDVNRDKKLNGYDWLVYSNNQKLEIVNNYISVSEYKDLAYSDKYKANVRIIAYVNKFYKSSNNLNLEVNLKDIFYLLFE